MQHLYRTIQNDPRFHTLERRRSRLTWSLSTLVLAAYFAFILLIAFNPRALAGAVSEHTVVTWGIVAGFGVIGFSLAATACYVWYANRYLDPLQSSVIDIARRQAETTRPGA